jgi:uncharacterized protein YjbI with pentapeptide repeats
MNSQTPGVKLATPSSIFKKNVKLDLRAIFTGVTKGIAHFGTGSLTELPGDAAEILGGLGLDSSTSEIAFLLIKRALFAASYDLARESISHFQSLSADAVPLLSDALQSKLENLTITLNPDFLANPQSLPLLRDIAPIFEQWLIDMGTSPHSAGLITKRFDSYFVFSLSSEWRKNHTSYKDLIETISTPFSNAEERERDWTNYFAMLDRRTHENIFDEPFSLSQIYVPLNAFYLERSANSSSDEPSFSTKGLRTVIDLEKNITDWMRIRQKDDAVRVISGGPGSGKSSFTKMLCATICEKKIAKPIYIPLHLIDPTRDVSDEVGRFARDEGFLRFNPLDPDLQINDIVLIFDGLDELASQGKVAAQVAKDFIHAVERMVERRNLGPSPVLVLISGRELVIQENETEFRKSRQILNVLPYYVPESERKDYFDEANLLDTDLRAMWWKNYGSLTNRSFSGIPPSLQKHEIDEITAQPLLNYLVALSYSRGKLDFEKSLNLNHVYADLVAAVYERGYEKNRIYKPINHIKQKDFVRVIEEIGLAAWHGSDGRSTSVNEILLHCKESGLSSLITTFQEGAKAGVTKLLAAFFFRQHGQQASGDATFVFTHKSFGEYLTAVRIVRGIDGIVTQLQRRAADPDDGYDTSQGLVQWTRLVGPAQMTSYIHRFLLREIEQRPATELRTWKDRLSELLSYAINKQIPMEKVGVLTFAEAFRQNVNASESLVVALNACAVALRKPIKLKLDASSSFGTFLRRISPQRVGPQSPILFEALSYFDFSGQTFDLIDLYGANLRNTKWSRSAMHYANLSSTNLSGASFDNAIMIEVDLSGARLVHAQLKRSNLSGAKLRNVDFEGTDLSKSNISYADVDGANFLETNVSNLRAEGVDFSGTRHRPASEKIDITPHPAEMLRTPPSSIKRTPRRRGSPATGDV